MNKTLICIFFINLFVLSMAAQEQKPVFKQDARPFALRLGIDLFKPIISLANNEDQISYEFVADFQFSKKWFAAMESGFSQKNSDEDFFDVSTKGFYSKIGANYNIYEDLKGINNEILLGFRYGFANFEHSLQNFTINSNDNYFENSLNKNVQIFDDLSAHWLELMAGIKVEILKNLFLGTSVSFNILLSEEKPDNFLNMYVPGFNRVYANKLGIGFNYTLSYRFPIAK